MTITIRVPSRIGRLAVVVMTTIGVIAGMALSAEGVNAAIEDASYTAITPCAVFDSRFGTGPYAGPYQGDKNGGVFTSTNSKTLRVTGSGLTNVGGNSQGGNADCGVPAAGVVAVHINIVAINPITSGNVVVVDSGGTPSGGIVNYETFDAANLNNSNAHNVPVSPAGTVDVYANCGANCLTDTVDVRGVVLGYWTDDLASRVAALENGGAAIPSGMIAPFRGSACPTGWAAYSAAGGRAIVGLPTGGTAEGTRNTPLSNLEDPTHSHLVDPPSRSTSSSGFHRHEWATYANGQFRTQIIGLSGDEVVWNFTNWNNGIGNVGEGFYPLSNDSAFVSGEFVTKADGSHTHSYNVPATTSSSVDTGLPYIQLLMCEKN